MTEILEKAIRNLLKAKSKEKITSGEVVEHDLTVIASIIQRQHGFKPHIICREGKIYVQAYPTRKKVSTRGKIVVYVNGSGESEPVEILFDGKKHVLSHVSFPVIRSYVSFLKKLNGIEVKKSLYFFSTNTKLPYLCDGKKYTGNGFKITSRTKRGDITVDRIANENQR